ncbi:CHAT domain-containing protein, partial [Streptomyces tricolor]
MRDVTAGSESVLELLPLVFADPGEARARAEHVLGAGPSPLHASVAHQVLGIWQRDFGDLRIALRHLRRARDLAARADSADREADVLATLGVALVHAGRTRQGLASFERGVARGSGHTRARVLYRRAYVWWVLGRHREALEDVRRALPVLRQVADDIWTARALTLRATVHLAVGAVDRAVADFTAAERLWDTTGQEHDKADAVESRGLAAFRSGDIPAALRLLDEAEERYAKLGTPTYNLSIRRCEVLMAAGLAPEALAEADAAIALLDRMGGQSTRKAELLLAASWAARSAGDAHTAIARAAVAVRLFAAQRRTWWETHARLVLLEARVAAGRRSGRMVADAAAVAERLTSFGSPAAPQASLLAGRIALAQEVSLAQGSPRRLLEWSERWRATVLSAPPTRPPDDPVLLSGLTAYREIAARAEAPRMEGRPVPALEREKRRLEREIRSRTRHMGGAAADAGDRFDVRRLLDRLGDARLVELAVVDGRVHVLLCGQGRVRRFAGGSLAEAVAEAEHVQAGLRRLAHPGAEARLPLVEAAGRRLQELLLAGAVPHLGSGQVVIVPPGTLHRVPWALLPALRERVLSVSPSAGSWLRARETAPPPDGRPVLVRGPGLATGGAEVPELADRYGTATVLEGDAAPVPRVLAVLDGGGRAPPAVGGARLSRVCFSGGAHRAAHGPPGPGLLRTDLPLHRP